jgi:hypothetical protein
MDAAFMSYRRGTVGAGVAEVHFRDLSTASLRRQAGQNAQRLVPTVPE